MWKPKLRRERKQRKKPIWSKEKVHVGPTYQVSVDDRVVFQISHSFTHIQAHPQQGFLGEAAPLAPEVVGQAAVLHELEHQADGSILKAHTIKLDQLGVRQLPVGQRGKVGKRLKQAQGLLSSQQVCYIQLLMPQCSTLLTAKAAFADV